MAQKRIAKKLYLSERIKGIYQGLKECWPAWLSIAGLVGAWAAAYFFASNFDDQIRCSGAVLQVLGLAVVATGIHKMRRLFELPSYKEVGITSVRKCLQAIKGPKDTSGAFEKITIPPPCLLLKQNSHLMPLSGTTLEERIETIEKNIDIVHKHANEIHEMVLREAGRLNNQDEEETFAREKAVRKVEDMIKEIAVGGIHLESVGLVWLVFGTIMGSIPDGVVAVINGLSSMWGK